MLASTVQFSTYDQRPPPRPHQTTPPPHGSDGAVCDQDGPAPHPERTTPRAGPKEAPLPQDPTACLPPPPTPTRFHTPSRTRNAVLGARDDRRPNWSAFHPRAPPHTHRSHPRLGDHHRCEHGSAPT